MNKFDVFDAVTVIGSVVEATSSTEFTQKVTIPKDGVNYVFNAVYNWNAATEEFTSTITHETCTEAHTAFATEKWTDCGDIAGFPIKVWIKTGFTLDEKA